MTQRLEYEVQAIRQVKCRGCDFSNNLKKQALFNGFPLSVFKDRAKGFKRDKIQIGECFFPQFSPNSRKRQVQNITGALGIIVLVL